MRKARVNNYNKPAGILTEHDDGTFVFEYDEGYHGEPISWTMPVSEKKFSFKDFPPFFDGLLPEGVMLASLLKQAKIDKTDYFLQLVTVGQDLVGSVTVEFLDD